MRQRTATRISRTLVLAVTAAVVVAGCGGDEPTKPDGGGASSAPQPVQLPLTGEISDTAPGRGVLVVKVDNTAAARPQQGLGSADLVVEELVEGGLTRLAVFYQSRQAETVGPVRSMRTSDIGIVAPAQALLAASGAARRVVAEINTAGIDVVTEDNTDAGFTRDSTRVAPYNLMLSPAALDKTLSDRPQPDNYLAWAAAGDKLPTGRPATSATMRFSPMHTTEWTYATGKGWRRTEELADQGQRFVPTNLLVLRVRLTDAGYHDPAGNPVPEIVLTGKGAALLLHEGRVIKARWSKATNEAPIDLTTASGAPLKVPAGHTWIELVPTDGAVTTAP